MTSMSCRKGMDVLSIPLRAFSSPPHRRTGAPGRATGPSWPGLFRRAESKSEKQKRKAARCGSSLWLLLWLLLCLLHLAFPNPLCSGELETTGPFRGSGQGCPLLFDMTWMSCRKARLQLTDLVGIHAHQARKRGAPLFGYFLSGKREKVTRPPKEDESSASKKNHAKCPKTHPQPVNKPAPQPRAEKRRPPCNTC
jgi:hypothetical protein